MIRARTGGVGVAKTNTSGAAMRALPGGAGVMKGKTSGAAMKARPGGVATRNTPGVAGAATG